MGEWKAYKVYMPWKSGDVIYMVGRVRDEAKPVEYDNIEWNGFYSGNADECKHFAAELNRKEAEANNG